jgi:hypothetical protein
MAYNDEEEPLTIRNHITKITQERDEAREAIKELLCRAYKFDEKPHQLFSQIRAMALKFSDEHDRLETIRLMDWAYDHVGEWQHSSNPQPTPTIEPPTCKIPPAGWYCTREVGHDGPCAAVEECWICHKPKGQGKDRCSGHYMGTETEPNFAWMNNPRRPSQEGS